jgi:MFS family permease
MRAILQKRALRFVLLANVVSMLGSGMNAAAVAWHILQATHSEMALGTLAVLQTLPAMLLLPFTGVIIDREDRRRLVMMLDSARALVILTISILAFRGKVQIWQLYLMNTLVAAGFWMFWPTITALIQELTPEGQFMEANTFLLAGIQGGWLMAGAIVGFVYNHIGLGGVLLIDFTAMLTGVVVTPSLSDRVFHAGAVGYGWLNAGWGVGAFLSALYAPKLIARLGPRLAIAVSMGFLASFMTLSPYSRILPAAVLLYGVMGSARGVSGVAMNTSLMEQVPKHFMGRVQNAFYFVGTFLQIALSLTVGSVAQKVSLAGGFAIIGSVYLVAFISAVWPIGSEAPAIPDVAQ